jgi:hypothetical protein
VEAVLSFLKDNRSTKENVMPSNGEMSVDDREVLFVRFLVGKLLYGLVLRLKHAQN